MRFDIARSGSGLTYEIRHIVAVANKLKDYGVEVEWENIGDPVSKGEKIPDWMKEVLINIKGDAVTKKCHLCDLSHRLFFDLCFNRRQRKRLKQVRALQNSAFPRIIQR